MLYDYLDQEKALILAQLYTRHTKLNSYLHRIGQSNSNLYAYGVEYKTVPHFLF
jgi:hypothetical protein